MTADAFTKLLANSGRESKDMMSILRAGLKVEGATREQADDQASLIRLMELDYRCRLRKDRDV